MNTDDMRVKSIDTALEWTKQIMTLAAGILVLSGTFIKDLFGANFAAQRWLVCSWVALCLCILCGIVYLGCLCAQLSRWRPSEVSLYAQPARCIGIAHFVSFLVAVGAFAVFSFCNLAKAKRPADGSGAAPSIEVRWKNGETTKFPMDVTKHYRLEFTPDGVHFSTR